jgi:hypothetical protein
MGGINFKSPMAKLTIQEIKDLAFERPCSSKSPEAVENMKKHATVIAGREFIAVCFRANNPKNELLEYRRYFDYEGNQIMNIGTENDHLYDLWNPEKKKTGIIFTDDVNKYSKIVEWVKGHDHTFARFKQASVCRQPELV